MTTVPAGPMRGPLPERTRQTALNWLAQRQLRLMPFLLVAPSVLLVAAFFVAPLGDRKSVV